MRRLAIIAILPFTLMAAMCEGTDQCANIGTISAVPVPAGAVETSANEYDTAATVKRVKLHNDVVSKVCGGA